MPAVQQHGLDMERILGGAYLGRPLPAGGYTDVFDIPADLTHDGRPVSIKTAKHNASGGTLGLGDARRIWATLRAREIVLICATYAQAGDVKIFSRVCEVVLTPEIAPHLLGALSLNEVATFHEGLLRFGPGEHLRARAWARAEKRTLCDRAGLITLNPKIDSKRQRRLQCSLRLNALLAIPGVTTRVHRHDYRGTALPIRIASGARQFSP